MHYNVRKLTKIFADTSWVLLATVKEVAEV